MTRRAGGANVVNYAYNAQGQGIWQKDQDGNVIETVYDLAGRALHRRVTTLAGGYDNAVLRISHTYDALGRTSLVTQWNHANPGSGSVVNEVKYSYDDWGNVGVFEQDRNSAVSSGLGDEYAVSYIYAKTTGGPDNLRTTSVSIPGETIAYTYSSGGGARPDQRTALLTHKLASSGAC